MFFACCYFIVTVINGGILLDKIPGYPKPMAIALLISIHVALLISITKALKSYLRSKKNKPKYSYSKILNILRKNPSSTVEARYEGINNRGWGAIESVDHIYNSYAVGNFKNTLLLNIGNGTLVCEPEEILEIRINNNKEGKIKMSIFSKLYSLFTEKGKAKNQLEYFNQMVTVDRQWLSPFHVELSKLCDNVLYKTLLLMHDEKNPIVVLYKLREFIRSYSYSNVTSFSQEELLTRYSRLLAPNWTTFALEDIGDFRKRVIRGPEKRD
jgi:hypothetical protein